MRKLLSDGYKKRTTEFGGPSFYTFNELKKASLVNATGAITLDFV
jgi:hypothetical protein